MGAGAGAGGGGAAGAAGAAVDGSGAGVGLADDVDEGGAVVADWAALHTGESKTLLIASRAYAERVVYGASVSILTRTIGKIIPARSH